MSEAKKNINTKSYFLRTQSSILKGENNIPINTVRSSLRSDSHKSKKQYSNNKNYFSTGHKRNKSKNYIPNLNAKNRVGPSFAFGKLDLNKVSGSCHYRKNKQNIKKEEINKNNQEFNERNINKNIYNPNLYLPFYELIQNLEQKKNNQKQPIPNDNFLKSNNIIDIKANDNKEEKYPKKPEFKDKNLKRFMNKKNDNIKSHKENNLKIGIFKNHNKNENKTTSPKNIKREKIDKIQIIENNKNEIYNEKRPKKKVKTNCHTFSNQKMDNENENKNLNINRKVLTYQYMESNPDDKFKKDMNELKNKLEFISNKNYSNRLTYQPTDNKNNSMIFQANKIENNKTDECFVEKHFLKQLFEENSTKNFIKTFRSKNKQNNTFQYNGENHNKLNILLQGIPRHLPEKNKNEKNNPNSNFSKSYTSRYNHQMQYIEHIMPPNNLFNKF